MGKLLEKFFLSFSRNFAITSPLRGQTSRFCAVLVLHRSFWGFAPDAAYFASVLPRHNLRPEWNAVAKAGYGALLLHHIALARPKTIIACGSRVWSLLAHETAQEPAALTNIAIDSVSVPAFAVPDMATLLRNPAKRAQTWNRWLEWNHSPP